MEKTFDSNLFFYWCMQKDDTLPRLLSVVIEGYRKGYHNYFSITIFLIQFVWRWKKQTKNYDLDQLYWILYLKLFTLQSL